MVAVAFEACKGPVALAAVADNASTAVDLDAAPYAPTPLPQPAPGPTKGYWLSVRTHSDMYSR